MRTILMYVISSADNMLQVICFTSPFWLMILIGLLIHYDKRRIENVGND